MTQEFLTLERAALGRFGLDTELRSLDLDTGRARALVTGDGPDVVLLPGGSMPAVGWGPLIADLDGFRLHAVELPGFCGPSDPLRIRPDTIREEAVRFVTGALDALGVRRAAFVSNSMGALWTFWTALDRPDRVGPIITMGCPALFPGTSAPLPMRLMSVRVLGRLMMRLSPPSPRQVDAALASAGVDLSRLPEVRDLVVALERLPHFQAAWLDLMNASLRPTGPRSTVALTEDQLSHLTQPVQLLWGDQDPFGTVDAGRHAAQSIPQSELHVLPGGHAPWLQATGAAATLAAGFLRRQAARSDDT